MTKQCCKCGVVLPLAAFYKNKGRPDGLQTVCQSCTKINNATWRSANPRAHIRHYANTELTPEQRADRDKRAREWVRDNPERHRELRVARDGKRRARKRGAFVEHVHPLVVLERADGVCGVCGGDVDPMQFEVDHITPLARGGAHSYSNTQPAHPSCNRRKAARIVNNQAPVEDMGADSNPPLGASSE